MNVIYYDIDLDDVIDVPACNYDDLLNSYLVEESILIPQVGVKIIDRRNKNKQKKEIYMYIYKFIDNINILIYII